MSPLCNAITLSDAYKEPLLDTGNRVVFMHGQQGN